MELKAYAITLSLHYPPPLSLTHSVSTPLFLPLSFSLTVPLPYSTGSLDLGQHASLLDVVIFSSAGYVAHALRYITSYAL